jgi:hypothetical protein
MTGGWVISHDGRGHYPCRPAPLSGWSAAERGCFVPPTGALTCHECCDSGSGVPPPPPPERPAAPAGPFAGNLLDNSMHVDPSCIVSLVRRRLLLGHTFLLQYPLGDLLAKGYAPFYLLSTKIYSTLAFIGKEQLLIQAEQVLCDGYVRYLLRLPKKWLFHVRRIHKVLKWLVAISMAITRSRSASSERRVNYPTAKAGYYNAKYQDRYIMTPWDAILCLAARTGQEYVRIWND